MGKRKIRRGKQTSRSNTHNKKTKIEVPSQPSTAIQQEVTADNENQAFPNEEVASSPTVLIEQEIIVDTECYVFPNEEHSSSSHVNAETKNGLVLEEERHMYTGERSALTDHRVAVNDEPSTEDSGVHDEKSASIDHTVAGTNEPGTEKSDVQDKKICSGDVKKTTNVEFPSEEYSPLDLSLQSCRSQALPVQFKSQNVGSKPRQYLKPNNYNTRTVVQKCAVCNKPFSDMSSMMVTHSFIHNGALTFVCNLCNGDFIRTHYHKCKGRQ